MMKRTLSLFLISVILTGSLCSCSKEGAGISSETSEGVETAEGAETSEDAETQTEASEETAYVTAEVTEANKESHYTFNPHLSSSVMDEIMGDQMRDTYFNLVDSVLAGETSFACPDQETYNWVMGQYPYLFFPVIREYIQMADGISYSDGVGYIAYKIPYEEVAVKIQEFEDLTVSILNEVLDDDYSDLEKAMALYMYFADNYIYDYYAADNLGITEIDEMLSGYRLLTEGTGICQEISVAYSFLLLEAGVDATVMKGVREYDQTNHQWSLVTIDGRYYHVDPTYALGSTDSLRYFMMTDDERYLEDSYNMRDSFPSTVYAQVYGFLDVSAVDDSYSPLWTAYITDWDTDANIITYIDNYGDTCEFDYENIHG